MPRWICTGFTPRVTYFRPSLIDRLGQHGGGGRAVAGDVAGLVATVLTSLAPMFSNGCGSSISLATVTPSLVMRGEPNDFCRTTLRPRGPSVALTARASCDKPRGDLRSGVGVEFHLFRCHCFTPIQLITLIVSDQLKNDLQCNP